MADQHRIQITFGPSNRDLEDGDRLQFSKRVLPENVGFRVVLASA